MRGRKRNQRPNVEEAPPRRVTMGAQGTMDNPEELPYCMQAVGSGYAGTSQSMAMLAVEEEDSLEQAAMEQSVDEEQDGGEVLDEDTAGDSSGEEL